MVKWKGQLVFKNTLHGKLTINQYESTKNPGCSEIISSLCLNSGINVVTVKRHDKQEKTIDQYEPP